MGLGIFKSIYRAIKYGEQVGKTAKNGAKVYYRSGKYTGLDKNGNIISTVRKFKTDPNTTRTITQTPLANGGMKTSTISRTEDKFDRSFSFFKDTKYTDEYGITRTVYDKPEFIQIHGIRSREIHVTTDTPVLINNRPMNSRKSFSVNY